MITKYGGNYYPRESCVSVGMEERASSGYKGSDGCIQAMSGLMRGIGAPGEAPIIPPGYQAQIIGGLSAFNGSMAFLLGRLMGTSPSTSNGLQHS